MMVSLAIGCSTLLVISVYISGVESHDTDTAIENTKKNQDQTQHDISAYFRPMLGKRAGYYTPRLGKRVSDDDDNDAHYPLWESVSQRVKGVESHETGTSNDQTEAVHHPLVLRWYTPRLGKRESYYTPRLGKRMNYYTPRLGKRMSYYLPSLEKCDTEDSDIPYSLRKTDDASALVRESRGEKEDKVWKGFGMFNPRLGRSVPSDDGDFQLAREYLKNTGSFSFN